MTINVPVTDDIERVVMITVDTLRWDYHEPYKDLYPNGVWYRGTAQATYTPTSHASAFTGMNPPRHGVLDFGQPITHDTLFHNVESAASHSGITREETYGGFVPIDDIETDHIQFYWMDSDPEPREQAAEAIDGTDFTFFHDWGVHACGPAHEGDWTELLHEDFTVEKNQHAYETHVGFSIESHQAFLEEMKERGLYEDTLFVVWGDHGQAFGRDPMTQYYHSNLGEDCTARVPVGFCSPAFDMDEPQTDLDTNARGVDIPPTLFSVMDEAGIEYEPFDHKVEGVDLTTFDGELYGYTLRAHYESVGAGESISDPDHWYVDFHKSNLYSTPDKWKCVMERKEDEMLAQQFEQKRKEVRAGPTKLVKRYQPDEDRLKELGYI